MAYILQGKKDKKEDRLQAHYTYRKEVNQTNTTECQPLLRPHSDGMCLLCQSLWVDIAKENTGDLSVSC